MKKIFFGILFFFNLYLQAQEFKFAFVTDTHIGSPNGVAEEDLERTVADINSLEGLDSSCSPVILDKNLYALNRETGTLYLILSLSLLFPNP